MTAVLAAAARAVLYGALGAVLVLTAAAAMIWPAYGPQGLWTVAWLGVTAVTAAGCGAAWEWLGKRRRKGAATLASAPCNCPCGCPSGGHRDDDGTPGWCDPCRVNIHQEA